MLGRGFRGVFPRLLAKPLLCQRVGAGGFTMTPSLLVRSMSSADSAAENIRNVAVIAHVDHGKTTLVDRLLRQCAVELAGERVMDSLSLEQERGITIMSKVTSLVHDNVRINVVDTPGHADFGGEVERVMSMVDGCLLVVCATEGPNTQTKFVTQKALAQGLRPILVINKVDRDTARVPEVEMEVLELFMSLHASDEQCDFPIVYASAREGWALSEWTGTPPLAPSMGPLLDAIVRNVPAPRVYPDAPFTMLASMMHYDNFLGRILTGRVHSGKARVGDAVVGASSDGTVVERGKISSILARRGMEVLQLEHARAGDIVQLAGLTTTEVAHTVCAAHDVRPLLANPIDPPTISMMFGVNSSPFQGQDGTKLTSAAIGERLWKETQNNVSISVEEMGEVYLVKGRGEMQLGVLIENMRREGFELSVSPPTVLFTEDEDGKRQEPMEEVTIQVDEQHVGPVVERLNQRKGSMLSMSTSEGGVVTLTYRIPARGLLGYRPQFTMDTRGRGVMNRLFAGYEPFHGRIDGARKRGVLISSATGSATTYALAALEPRGQLFVRPQTKVYEGMIVGEFNKEGDLMVNPTKAKQLTNIRAAGSDDLVKLTPPRTFTLEDALTYCVHDELLEVTPKHIRLRKLYLTEHERKVKKPQLAMM